MLTINKLGYQIKSGRHLLRNLQLSITPGERIAIVGHNGSGKTTLLKLLEGLITPTHGTIQHKKNKPHIMRLTQNPHDSLFPDMSILENLQLYDLAHHKKMNSLHSIKADLSAFSKALTQNLHQKVNTLSGGEQQLLALALCMRHQPNILLLDEHTAALDPHTSTRIMQHTFNELTNHHVTCLFTTHDLPLALPYATRVITLQSGEITQDVPITQYRPTKQSPTSHLIIKAAAS